jgi:hypothetical protein
LHGVAQSLNREFFILLHRGIFMAGDPSLIQYPSGFLWGAALRAVARRRFKISIPCENALKQQIKSGLDVNRVGLSEFTERKAEAQSNIEKLIATMINAQLAKDPKAEILDDWTVPHALYDEKLCPALWPIC